MKPALVVTRRCTGKGLIYGLATMGVPVVLVAYEPVDLDVSRYVKTTIHVPHPEKDEEGFVAKLIELAEEYEGSFLTPATDEALVSLSRNKAILSNHYTVACTDWDITELFIDKSQTYKLANDNGIPAPKTLTPTSIEEVDAYGRTVDYPCLIKPRQSHVFGAKYRKKMFPVDDFDQLITLYKKVAEDGQEVMIQEFIPGDDPANVNYNSYCCNGYDPVEFTARKVRNSPPKYGSPRVVVSQDIPEIIEPGRKILEVMRYKGFSCVEFKKDARNGVYKLMEVNGRHNLSAMLAIRCGINFPWIEYVNLMFDEAPTSNGFEKDVYWVDFFTDIKQSLRFRQTEKYSIREYLKPYVSPTVFAVLDWRDPKPFAKRIISGLRRSDFR